MNAKSTERSPDPRLAALTQWVTQVLDDACAVRPASADASFRRYFRVRPTSGPCVIAMDAPPEREDCGIYVRVAQALAAMGLHVPSILAQDLPRGFLLITDLGERLYLGALDATTVGRLYQDAMNALVRLQQARPDQIAWLPPYDADLLSREMELFREWYLGRHLGLALTAHTHAQLDGVFQVLLAAALEQPAVAVHRDYHSRNLLVTESNNPGILDFQDAVVGPVTYDLVSLLKDCYIAWPRERVEAWAVAYQAQARAAGVPIGADHRTFLRWFDLMGVQRHLKAAGIFARLHHRDGKSGYLGDIPRTLSYVYEVASRHGELAPLAALLTELDPRGDRVAPA